MHRSKYLESAAALAISSANLWKNSTATGQQQQQQQEQEQQQQ